MRVLSALGDSTRARMVELLATGEYSVGELCKYFSISQPAVSQHLKVLREAHLAKVRVVGQRRLYSLCEDGIQELSSWLERVRDAQSDRITSLDNYLDADP